MSEEIYTERDISIVIASDNEHEKVVAEIEIAGLFVALLNQDEGEENLKIEFPGPLPGEDSILRELDLKLFETALEMAKKELVG